VSYEIGSKLEFLDNRVRLNAAIFTSDYDPRVRLAGGVVQCDFFDDPDPQPYRGIPPGGVGPEGSDLAGQPPLSWFYYDNLPGTLTGYEAELNVNPLDNMLINYSLGYNHYENDDQNPLSSNYINPDYLQQPEFNMSFGIQYEFQLGGGGTLIPRLDAFYQSKRHTGPSNARPGIHELIANTCPDQCIPSYTILNARLTYEPPNGDWRLSLAATNLLDKLYWQQLGQARTVNAATGAINANGPPAARSGVISRPREWALTLEKQF
jgi:iron complex outermembrane recepter protein